MIGRLERGLTTDAFRAAKEAAAELSSRESVLELLTRLTDEFKHRQDIDGPARERLVGLFTHLGQQCNELASSMEELTSLRRNAARIDTITRVRDMVVTGIQRIVAEVVVPSGDQLVDAAYRHAGRVLGALLPLFRGQGTIEREVPPLALSLHAPLLWLPGLFWTGGWQPSPYDAGLLGKQDNRYQRPTAGSRSTRKPGKGLPRTQSGRCVCCRDYASQHCHLVRYAGGKNLFVEG